MGFNLEAGRFNKHMEKVFFYKKLKKTNVILFKTIVSKASLLMICIISITFLTNILTNYSKSSQGKLVSTYISNNMDISSVPVKDAEHIKLLVGTIKDENINLYSIGYGTEGGYILSQFILDIKGKTKTFNWTNIKNPLYYPKLLYKDINNDGENELIVVNTIEIYGVLKQETHIVNIDNLNEIQSHISIDDLIESKPNYKNQVNNSAIIKLMFPNKTFTEKKGVFSEKSAYPTDYTIESIEKGSFVSKNAEEYLVVVKQTGAPHAVGLENRLAAVINATKTKLLSSVMEFSADNGQIITFKGKDISYVYFGGTRTYQGYTYSLDNTEIGLWRAGQEWHRLWQKDQDYWKDNVPMATNDSIYIYTRKVFTNNPNETVLYAWELKSILKWDANKESFNINLLL